MGNCFSRGSGKKEKLDPRQKDYFIDDDDLKESDSIGVDGCKHAESVGESVGESVFDPDSPLKSKIDRGSTAENNFPTENEDETDYPVRTKVEEPIERETLSQQCYSSPEIIPAADEIDFPFLNDSKTISYIKMSKTMFIMRGISGSGKSTLVNLIQKVYPDMVVCSADFYFIKEDGSYQFQHDLLSYAHNECQKNARDACFKQNSVVVIDNTNIRRWEMKTYLDLAREFDYVVVPVRPRTRWREDPHELFKRNKHGVGLDVIEKKVRTFEDVIPFYYGWFLNNHDSTFLYQLGTSYLKSFLCNFPHLARKWIWGDTDITLSSLQQYFGMKPNLNSLLHCTAFYCGNRKNPTPGRENYHRSQEVQYSCGRVFPLCVTGITISARTVAARIGLTMDQLPLLYKPEEIQRDEYIYKNCGLQNTGPSNKNYPQKGRCAHVTLATASGINASQANFDILDICDKEYFLSTTNKPVPTYPVDKGVIQCLDDEYCVVNFDQPVVLNGLFSGLY